MIKGGGYGRKSDVWSAGCVLLEMLDGHPPWSGTLDGKVTNQYTLMFQIASSTEPPPMSTSMGEDVRALLMRCFAREPDARSTAAALLDDGLKRGFFTAPVVSLHHTHEASL